MHHDPNAPHSPAANRVIRSRRRLLLTAPALACAAATVLAVAPPARAQTSATIDFTAPGYTAAASSPAGQNGWTQARGDADISLVDNDDFPDAGLPAGGRSLQFSNTTSPSGGADLVAPNIDPAGEPDTGAGANTFELTFTVASATGDVQAGLDVDVAIDGASRYGGVINLRHTAQGLAVGSYWLPEGATDTDNASWRSAVYTTVPADRPHVIRMVDVFLKGQPDSVSVYVDGALVSGGSGVTTWEYYNRLAAVGGNQTAETISFKRSSSAPTDDGIGYRSGLPTAPDTAGRGFLFTGISYSVSTSAPPVPTAPPTLPSEPAPQPDAALAVSTTQVPADGGPVDFSADGFLPYENVYATLFDPTFAGWFQADVDGRVAGTVTIPAGAEAGPAVLQLIGAASGFVAATTITIQAAPTSGPPTTTTAPSSSSPSTTGPGSSTIATSSAAGSTRAGTSTAAAAGSAPSAVGGPATPSTSGSVDPGLTAAGSTAEAGAGELANTGPAIAAQLLGGVAALALGAALMMIRRPARRRH